MPSRNQIFFFVRVTPTAVSKSADELTYIKSSVCNHKPVVIYSAEAAIPLEAEELLHTQTKAHNYTVSIDIMHMQELEILQNGVELTASNEQLSSSKQRLFRDQMKLKVRG